MSIGRRATRLADPVEITRGSDFSMLAVVTQVSDGADYAINTATISCDILNVGTGAVVDSFTTAVAGAGNNELTISLTDAETTALTAGSYTFVLDVTEGTDTWPWLAGSCQVVERGNSGPYTSGTTARVKDNTLLLTIT